MGPIAAGAIGGFLGGALNAGLNGANFKQAMIGGAIGAGIGALGGAAFGSTGTNGFLGSWGPGVGMGLLVAGGAYAAATDNLDTFAGAIVGGVGGWATGTRISTGRWPGSSPNIVRQSPAEKAQKSLSTDQQYKLTTNYDVEGKPVSFNLMPGENKTIVIGESAKRVISYARGVGAEYFEPSTSNLTTQQMWAENETWLINKLNSGYRVVDLGLDNPRPVRGIFYPMENQTIAEWSSTTGRTVIYGTK